MRRQTLVPFVLVSVAFSLLASKEFGLAATPQERTYSALEVFPKQLALESIRDSRRLIVTAVDEHGKRRDVSHLAKLTPASDEISIDADGYVVPAKSGETEVAVSAVGLEARVPVRVKDVSAVPVDFVREVIPVISKVGCNAGTCHGAQQGRAGFKLSLRGYDPLFDYRALVDDLAGRRFNRAEPSQSLMLLKPTQGVPHEGGFLFDEDSREYKLLYQWIAEGCRFAGDSKRVERLEVFPKTPLLESAEETQQLIVVARYPDGSSRDVSREAVFETSNLEVIAVSETGRIKALRRGDAAALVRYEGVYEAAPVTVLGSREGYAWVDSPEFNFIDTHVNNKLERSKILPSELCSDLEFLRRISFDLTGVPPDLETTRAFAADDRDSQTKRAAKVDELLASPEFVDHWTLKWSDLLLNRRKTITETGVWAFRNWIRKSIATNKPYDEFVYELMTASGSTFEYPAANYYRVARQPNEVMENMTQVFLGTRFQCNQCHDHPFERWTQQQYYQLSAFFAGVGRTRGPRKDEEIIFPLESTTPVVHPGTGQAVEPVFPFEHAGIDGSSSDRREQLARWLTARQNPYFAKSIVNRYWSYFLGRGIIDPVDDIRASNPPSNPELLEALTDDFIQNDFDLKRLIRLVVSSHTYQRSYRSSEWNEEDSVNFSHALPRRLAAEQLYDAIIIATGAPNRIPGAPAGFRATQLPDPSVPLSFLDMFGRAPRESPCECERSSAVSLGQTLNLVNGPTISEAIIHPDGLIARQVKQNVRPEDLLEDVYLSVLCRFPTDEERKHAEQYFVDVGHTDEAAEDIMWALINSPAFLFNR